MRWRRSFKHDSHHEVTADGGSEIDLINKVFRQDTGQVFWRAQAIWSGSGLPVDETAKSFPQVSMALQVAPESLSHLSAADNKNMLITNAAFDALEVITLHHVTQAENAGKAEERRVRQRSTAAPHFLQR